MKMLAQELGKAIEGEVRFDSASRLLYSTDASIYQIEPQGVVIPKTRQDVLATVRIAGECGARLGLGRWQFPSLSLDSGETPFSALWKESFEG